jgi:hypothetical protein
MEPTMKRFFAILLPILMIACFLPVSIATNPPTPTTAESPCAFVEGRKTLEDISKQLLDKLTSVGLPVENARAEAYGENCIAEDGSVVHFAARETDFYVTLTVANLTDDSSLGSLLEQTLTVIDQFPADQTPGPNPGYVGITFKVGEQEQHLWFMQTQINDLRAQGLKGADLYRALKGAP